MEKQVEGRRAAEIPLVLYESEPLVPELTDHVGRALIAGIVIIHLADPVLKSLRTQAFQSPPQHRRPTVGRNENFDLSHQLVSRRASFQPTNRRAKWNLPPPPGTISAPPSS